MKIAVIIHDSNNEHGSGENRCISNSLVFNQYIKCSDGKLKLFEHTSEINGKAANLWMKQEKYKISIL